MVMSLLGRGGSHQTNTHRSRPSHNKRATTKSGVCLHWKSGDGFSGGPWAHRWFGQVVGIIKSLSESINKICWLVFFSPFINSSSSSSNCSLFLWWRHTLPPVAATSLTTGETKTQHCEQHKRLNEGFAVLLI